MARKICLRKRVVQLTLPLPPSRGTTIGRLGASDVPSNTSTRKVEARCNMTTLLLSQRVNRMFNDTIQGSVKLQKALWFTELEGSRDHRTCTLSETKSRINPLFSKRNYPTKVFVEALRGLDWYAPRKSIAVEMRSKAKNGWTGPSQSWSRMLIAQTIDQTCVPMELDAPELEYKFLRGGPYFTMLCAPDTAADVLELAEDLAHEDYLDLLKANMDKEELSKEVQKLKAQRGYLYRVAKTHLKRVTREQKNRDY